MSREAVDQEACWGRCFLDTNWPLRKRLRSHPAMTCKEETRHACEQLAPSRFQCKVRVLGGGLSICYAMGPDMVAARVRYDSEPCCGVARRPLRRSRATVVRAWELAVGSIHRDAAARPRLLKAASGRPRRQSRPAWTIAWAMVAGAVNQISWLPSHSIRRYRPSFSERRGCHGRLCGKAVSSRQLT